MEQQIIHDLLIHNDHRIEFRRDGENYMEVLDGQKVLLSGLNPLFFFQCLAFGTVPVPAGVVGYLDVAAILALVPMASKYCRPAYLHSVHGPQMTKRQGMRLPIIGAVAA